MTPTARCSTRWASSPTRWPATSATPIPSSAPSGAEHAGRASHAEGFDLEERLTATVYRYDDVAAVLRDNETLLVGRSAS